MTLVPRVLDLLRQAGLADVGVLVGGIIPEEDVRKLIQLGVARVFGPGHGARGDRGVPPRARGSGSQEQLARAFPHGDRRALSRLLTPGGARGRFGDDPRRAARRTSGQRVRRESSPSRAAAGWARAR